MQRLALTGVFRTVAAIHATHSEAATVPNDDYSNFTNEAGQRERAGNGSSVHRIKFVEALMREYALDPREEFLAAALLM